MAEKTTRRTFIKTAATLAGAAGAGSLLGAGGNGQTALAAPYLNFDKKAGIPETGTTRAVVVGGGWGGLTMAKNLKKLAPEWDVVLVESRYSFLSCPISNLWLAGLVTYEFLSRSYWDAARHNGYTFLNATVVGADREKRTLYTDQGWLNYDYLVLAPGIDYDYDDIGMHDPVEQQRIQQYYPAAFKPGSEHLTLKRKIDEFEKGLFVLTVPSGNYRCPPAPYERACMIASVFKRKKLPAKVLLLDFNPRIKIKEEGFRAAFEELYKDYIEYIPSVAIYRVDIDKKRIVGEFEDYEFDDASIYPRVRGAKLIETLGLVSESSPQKEAKINLFRNNLHDDESVYVVGDSRPMGFSKSGSTAQGEARFVAKVIVERSKGNEIDWQAPYTSCYSMVNADPPEAIYFGSKYLRPLVAHTPMDMERVVKAWIERGSAFAWRDRNMQRSTDMGDAMIGWAEAHFAEMFK